MNRILFCLLLILPFSPCHAEYRLYELGVKYDPKQKQEVKVLSTLDDIQYMTYYKISPQQQTRIIDHWMCPGRTDHLKRYCSRPPQVQSRP